MKIAYCLNSIRYLGGIQRVTIVKANALAEVPGNEVYILVTDNKNGILVHPLSPKVHLIDLDVNYYLDDWKSKWNILKGIFIKRHKHKKKLTQALHKINPDIIISAGQSEKNMIPTITGNWIKIRELHFTRNYRQLHARSTFEQIVACIGDFYDYHYKIKGYDHIVVLTQEDKKDNWDDQPHVSVIPNPISFTNNHILAELEEKKAITIGRLSYPKNYKSLINVWKIVTDKHSDWLLEIWGAGEAYKTLNQRIISLGLQNNIFLKGYTNDVSLKLAESSLFILSSIFEGFGLVIIEAMSCGVPVVSYACPCGPQDIIADGHDGFLVPVNNEKVLADRICRLIEDKELRKEMGKAARLKAEQYDIKNIIPMWMELFNQLINEKRK